MSTEGYGEVSLDFRSYRFGLSSVFRKIHLLFPWGNCAIQLNTLRKQGTALLSRYDTPSSQRVKEELWGTMDFQNQ